jgi:hypothetical protein
MKNASAAVLVLALAAAGCGGGGSKSKSSSATSTTSTTAARKDPARRDRNAIKRVVRTYRARAKAKDPKSCVLLTSAYSRASECPRRIKSGTMRFDIGTLTKVPPIEIKVDHAAIYGHVLVRHPGRPTRTDAMGVVRLERTHAGWRITAVERQ